MKNIIFSFFIISAVKLFGYIDNDLDGVDDKDDKCLHTPFFEIVDQNGCSIKKIQLQDLSSIDIYHFNIIAGISYSKSDYRTLNQSDTYTSSLEIDYFYKKFSIELSTSYFMTQSNGYTDKNFYDTLFGISYMYEPLSQLALRFQGGVVLPTYDTSLQNNKTDYTIGCSITYDIQQYSIYGSFNYTWIGDEDRVLSDTNNTVVLDLVYQNIASYSIGVGRYFSNQFYTSLSYSNTKSIYKGVEDIQNVTLYFYYNFNKHFFSSLTYGYGLSDSASDHYIGLRVGYYF